VSKRPRPGWSPCGGAESGADGRANCVDALTPSPRFALAFADEGGGTRFLSHGIGTFHSSMTSMLAHSGKLRHEGLPISRGRRYLLVGFIREKSDCD